MATIGGDQKHGRAETRCRLGHFAFPSTELLRFPQTLRLDVKSGPVGGVVHDGESRVAANGGAGAN